MRETRSALESLNDAASELISFSDLPVLRTGTSCPAPKVAFAEGKTIGLLIGQTVAGEYHQSTVVHAIGAPAGGNYQFTIGDGSVISSTVDGANATLSAVGLGRTSIKVTYTTAQGSADATLKVIVYRGVAPSLSKLRFVFRAIRTPLSVKGADGNLWPKMEFWDRVREYRNLDSWPANASLDPANSSATQPPVKHVSGDNVPSQFHSTSKKYEPCCQCSMFNYSSTSPRETLRRPTWWAPVAIFDVTKIPDGNVWIIDLSTSEGCKAGGFDAEDHQIQSLCMSDHEVLVMGRIPGFAVTGMLLIHQVVQGCALSASERATLAASFSDSPKEASIMESILKAAEDTPEVARKENRQPYESLSQRLVRLQVTPQLLPTSAVEPSKLHSTSAPAQFATTHDMGQMPKPVSFKTNHRCVLCREPGQIYVLECPTHRSIWSCGSPACQLSKCPFCR